MLKLVQTAQNGRISVGTRGHVPRVRVPPQNDVARMGNRGGTAHFALPPGVRHVKTRHVAIPQIAVGTVQRHAQVIAEHDPTVFSDGDAIGDDGGARRGLTERILRSLDHVTSRRTDLLKPDPGHHTGAEEHDQVHPEQRDHRTRRAA